MSFISALRLHTFRSYDTAHFGEISDALPCAPIVLYGKNGAGKTNVLEAISLLSPGRGIRGAKVGEIQNCADEKTPWAVSANIHTKYGDITLGTGREPSKETRIVKINGEKARGQNALAEYLSCVWLTPQMDGLFIDSSSSRRRFFDRLVFAFDPAHTGRLTRYENAMRQRSKILQTYDAPDPSWLSGLEKTMAETGVAIAAARTHFLEKLQTACHIAAKEDHGTFPRAQMRLSGTLEGLLSNAPALEVESLFEYQLQQSRKRDAETGGSATGPHKTDLLTLYSDKNMPADQCSTGEQKALLIGIILAHARLIKAEKGFPPILLLDEVTAHLDEGRRILLHDILLSLGGQVWLTGTDAALFSDLENRAAFFEITGGNASPSPLSKAA